MSMGSLELPLPQLGEGALSLEDIAKEMQTRIRTQTPESLRKTVKVRPFEEGDRTGIVVEFDDRAERFVYIALEYPARSGRAESTVPRKTKE